jgi:hypothetical protein
MQKIVDSQIRFKQEFSDLRTSFDQLGSVKQKLATHKIKRTQTHKIDGAVKILQKLLLRRAFSMLKSSGAAEEDFRAEIVRELLAIKRKRLLRAGWQRIVTQGRETRDCRLKTIFEKICGNKSKIAVVKRFYRWRFAL